MPEQFLDLLGFPLELGVVVEVLILTAAALGENRTGRLDAMGGWAEDFDEVAFGVVFVVAVDADADELAGEGEADHDDPVVVATEALSHVCEGVDFQLNLFVVLEGLGAKLAGDSGLVVCGVCFFAHGRSLLFYFFG